MSNDPTSQRPPVRSIGFGLIAVLNTVAILTCALITPLALNEIVPAINALRGTPGGLENWSAEAQTWAYLLTFQATVILLVVVMADVARGSGPGIGWQPPFGRRRWLLPLVVSVIISAATTWIAFTFFPDVVARDLEPIAKLINAVPLWVAFLGLSIGAPLSEELLFRGYLLHRLRQTRLGFWGAAIVANTGWTLLHFDYSWLGLTDVFIAGMLFTWALWRTGSIWVPIAFHAIYNALVLFVMVSFGFTTAAPTLLWL